MTKLIQKTSRRDIQGLRTIGALLVAIFHIWEIGISGGVDVFFVVAGYFLGVGYAYRIAQDQSLRAADHFGGFVQRTVPQVLFVLTAILILGFLLTSPFYWRPLLRDVAFSAFYIENYYLIWRGQDYMARDEAASLAQHFWAVSLIAQAYAAWWPLTRAAEGMARGWKGGCNRLWFLTVLLSILIVLSLAWSVIWTEQNPTAAYFDLLTRYWQFGIGALLGLWLSDSRRGSIPETLATPLSWLGLSLLLSCGLVIGATAAFPGYAAIWPVAAAGLILLTSREGQRMNAGRVLALRPLARLGSYSFGIYLWHWPPYVLVLQLTGDVPSIGMGAAIISASILLAYWSQNLADRFVKAAERRLRPMVVFTVCMAGLVTLAALVFFSHQTLGKSHQMASSWIIAPFANINPGINPGPLSIRADSHRNLDPDCEQTVTSPDVWRCEYGVTDSDTVLFLVGGSHSGHWLPALKTVAVERGWLIVSITKSTCLFASPKDEELYITENLHPSCGVWNDAVIETILTERPDVVLTLATRAKFSDPIHRGASDVIGEYVPKGYLLHFNTLASNGIQVVAIRDTPRMGHDVPACVFAHRWVDPDTCGNPRTKVLYDQALPAELAQIPVGVAYVDMSDTVCDESTCSAVRDGLLIYRDRHHLSATYARFIGPILADRIEAALTSGIVVPKRTNPY